MTLLRLSSGGRASTRRWEWLGGEHFLEGAHGIIDRDVGHIERFRLENLDLPLPRPPADRIRSAEESHQRLAERGSDVHGAAIGENDPVACGEPADEFTQVGRWPGQDRKVVNACKQGARPRIVAGVTRVP